MKTQSSQDCTIDYQHPPDAMPTTTNESIKGDEQDREEEDIITRRNEEALIEAIMKIRIDELRHSCPSRVTSSSSSSLIKRPLPLRAESEPDCLRPKSILLVRTNDESLKRTSLRHHHHHRRRKVCNNNRGCNEVVAFMSVQVQEYPITLGDNPSVSSGPPLTLDWTPLNSHTYNIDKYEELRRPHRRHSSAELTLPHSQRWYSLLRMGSSPTDIYECQELAAKERERRLRCLSMTSFITFRLQARMELMCRGMKNIILKKRKVNQRKWIQQGLKMDHEAFESRSASIHCDDSDDQSDGSEDEYDCWKVEMDNNDGGARKTEYRRTNPLKIADTLATSSATDAQALSKDANKTKKVPIPSPRLHVAKSA